MRTHQPGTLSFALYSALANYASSSPLYNESLILLGIYSLHIVHIQTILNYHISTSAIVASTISFSQAYTMFNLFIVCFISGHSSCDSRLPGINIRIDKFMNWIREKQDTAGLIKGIRKSNRDVLNILTVRIMYLARLYCIYNIAAYRNVSTT